MGPFTSAAMSAVESSMLTLPYALMKYLATGSRDAACTEHTSTCERTNISWQKQGQFTEIDAARSTSSE